eukprot:COSAG02_NODE_58816_length_276_cov_0.587571_1_plen_71_part_01
MLPAPLSTSVAVDDQVVQVGEEAGLAAPIGGLVGHTVEVNQDLVVSNHKRVHHLGAQRFLCKEVAMPSQED